MTVQSNGPCTSHLTKKWQRRELRELLPEYAYLNSCTNNLLSRYQVPIEASLMIGCAALSAAAGGTFRLRAPTSSEICPAIHLLVASNRPMAIHFAVIEIFEPILSMVRSLVAENEKEAEACAAKLRGHSTARKKDAAAIEKKAADYRSMVLDRFGLDLDKDPNAVRFFGTDYHQHLEEVLSADAEAKRAAGLAKFIRRPGMVVEAIHPSDWMVPEAYACDHAMFNFDPCGSTWRELLGETSAVRRKIAHKVVAGLEGATFRYGGKTSPAWHLSSLSVVPPSIVSSLSGSIELCEAGLTRQFITVESNLADSSVGEFKPGAADPTFARLLTVLHELRIHSDAPVIWALAPEAEDVFLQFVGDLNGQAEDLQSESSSVIASFVLRTCIWLRLGAQDGFNRTDPIGVADLRNAITVALHVQSKAPVLLPTQLGQCFGPADNSVAIMVEKIRLKGPIRFRDLHRSYHSQRKELLSPVLDRALAAGLIKCTDGFLSVATSPNSPAFAA